MTDNNIIYCAIVDDEHLARELLEDYVSKIPKLKLVGSFESPLELMNSEFYDKLDILLLDIQMPDITGIDFVKTMNKKKPLVIFTTAYSEYALEGYELNIIEYLLKPIAFPRFIKAINKAVEHLNTVNKAQSSDIINFVPSTENKNIQDYIIVKADRKKYKINYNEILFIEGALEYVTFRLEKKKITAFYSLKELEKLLPNNQFIRVHRSYIANINKINELEGNQLIIKDHKLPIGANYKKNVDQIFV
jgi:DNA-binding LytR/AlgR family response regulator